MPVAGTAGRPYLFGAEPTRRPIEIRDFHVMSTPVTQALWTRVMGSNPAERDQPRHPVENVSWDHITGAGGFLDLVSMTCAAMSGSGARTRALPTWKRCRTTEHPGLARVRTDDSAADVITTGISIARFGSATG